MSLPSSVFKEITWGEGTDRKLHSRFAAVRVRPAHRDYEKAQPHEEEWLLIEWPRREKEPIKYWISTLSPDTKLKALVKMLAGTRKRIFLDGGWRSHSAP
jgi:SRSO17 transposase